MNGALLGQPRRVAVVGASERSFFARFVLQNLVAQGFEGDVFPVNPRATEVLGMRAYPSVQALPAPPDLAVVALAPERCAGAVVELADTGTRVVVVLSDGFAETGRRAGARLERELAELCHARQVTMIGPNCVGAADFQQRVVCLGQPIPGRVSAGPVSIISQSGGLLTSILDALGAEGLGADLCVSIGNGAAFDVVDGLATALERPTTRAVCAYVESFGSDADRLERTLARARQLAKPIVLAKVGSSELGRRIAFSHTATVAGPDAYIDSLLRRSGVHRCADIEELARVTAVALHVGSLGAAGVAVLGGSGGTAGLVGDLVAAVPMPLAEFSRETVEILRAAVPDSGFAGNPLDLSGRSAGSPEVERACDAVFADPDVAAVLLPFSVTLPDHSPGRVAHRDYLELLAAKADSWGKPLLVATLVAQSRPAFVDELVARHPQTGVYIGLRATVAALARVGRPRRPAAAARHRAGKARSVLSEAGGRERLRSAGIPVVPGETAATPSAAAAALGRLGPPVVVKAILPGQAHKSRVGGVEVGLVTVPDVEAACARIAERTGCDGFLVERMVSGIELLLGLERDAVYGPALTVGLGGALAETAGLHATALLAEGEAPDVAGLFARAGLERLLASQPAAARRRLLAVVARAAREFSAGRLRDCASVEINPLFVTPAGEVLAADALVVVA